MTHEMVALGDLVDFYSGGTPSKGRAEYWSGDTPWFSAKDIKRSRLVDSIDHINAVVFDETSLRRIPRGTVVLVVRGMILAHTVPIAVLDVDAAINQDLKALLPKREIDPTYLAAMLRAQHATLLGQVSTAAHGTSRLETRVLEETRIPLPPIEEQRRLAAILDQADAIRAKRRQILTHLDALTQSTFHAMFDGEPAGAVVDQIAEQSRTGPFGSQLLVEEFVDEGVAVLGLDNVVGNEFRWVGRRYITPEKYETLKRYTVAPGDVLISIMGTTGRCVVVPEDIPVAINTKHICAVTPDADRVDPEFLRASFLWHPETRAHLRRQTKGAIMAGLNMGIIKTMPIPLPSIERQRKFAFRTAVIAAQRNDVERVQAADDELFASLQSRAFRGEL